MKVPCPLATRETIRAFYSEGILLIVATGMVSAGERVDIEMDTPSNGPPLQFRLLRCPKPGVWPRVMESYVYREFFLLTRHPDRVRIGGPVRVRHHEGTDEVPLESFPEDLPRGVLGGPQRAGERSATGYSSNLSFDEAFANALAILREEDEPQPDELLQVRVEEVGGLFGGFAGFHELYVRLVAPQRARPGDVIAEIAPTRPGPIIVEVGPQRPGTGQAEVITEVGPQRPGTGQAEVITEVGPHRPGTGQAEIVTEVGPQRPEPGAGQAEVITEVAPGRISRPDGEVIVEVAPDRPEDARRQGPIAEVAPDRPEGS